MRLEAAVALALWSEFCQSRAATDAEAGRRLALLPRPDDPNGGTPNAKRPP